MDPLQHIKPAVRELAAYQLVGRSAPVKVNQNENPYDLPDWLKQKVVARALERPWSRYPGIVPSDLIEALSAHTNWPSDGILVGNGSNELIEALLRITVGPGTSVVIPEPTFSLYAMLTTILGGECVRVPLSDDLQYDVAALEKAQSGSQAPLLIVCSPNNPTGGVLPIRDLRRLCESSEALVVVDEAYVEFATETALSLLAAYPNLAILRTFSKARSLAGLRVGYLLADPDLVEQVNKARLPYSLDFFSELAALAVLEEQEAMLANVRRMIEQRELLSRRLAELPGVRTIPSRANFFLVELTEAAPRAVFDELRVQGVLVRDVTRYPRLERCLRVSVGSEQENETLLMAFQRAVLKARSAKQSEGEE